MEIVPYRRIHKTEKRNIDEVLGRLQRRFTGGSENLWETLPGRKQNPMVAAGLQNKD